MYRADPLLVPGSPSIDIVEVFHSYVDQEQLDLVANLMEQKGIGDKYLIIEAWWTLVVRAIFQSCTLHCATLLSGNEDWCSATMECRCYRWELSMR